MIVVNTDLGIQTVLLRSLVILIVILNICNSGSLKVYHQGELEDVALVGLNAAVAVVQEAFQTNRILGVVGQIVVHGIELNLHVCGIDGAAIAIGLADIGINSLKNHFTRSIIRDGDDDLLGITKQTSPDKTQGVDRTILIGQCNIILIRGNDHILGVLNEIIGTQIADIILRYTADGTAGVRIGQILIFHGDGVVTLVGISFIVLQVEQRSNSPVTEVSQIRNAHVDIRTGGSLQSDITFDIHTVFEGVVQVGLVSIGQRDLHSDFCIFAAFNSDLLSVSCTTGYRNQLNGTAQSVCLLSHSGLTGAGLGVADALSQNIGANLIRQCGGTEVVDRERHLIDTRLRRVVTQLQLGLVHCVTVFIVSSNVSLGIQAVSQVCETSTLLTDSVRQAVLIQGDVSGGHHQFIDHLPYLDIVIGDVGEILHHILTQQNGHASKVGASHGGTRQTVITAAGNGRENVTTVSGDLRLNAQAGSGAPGGEVRNEGTGSLVPADGQLAVAGSHQSLAIILRNGADSQLGITDAHLDVTGNVVVNNDTGSTLSFGDHSLFLEGVGTTADKGDLALHIHTGIVSATANTGNDNILHLLGLRIAQKVVYEILLNSSATVGLNEVNDGLTVLQVGSLLTVDRRNRHNTLVGRGRTDGTGVGVRSQRQVTVLLRTVSRVVAVGSSNDHANTGFTNLVVNAVHDLFVRLTGKAAGSTQRHIDDINTQNNTVLQSGQNPAADGGIVNIREDLHGNQLCIGRNTGNGIIFTDDNTGNVGTMVVMGRINVRVVISVVITEGDLVIDVHVIHRQAAIHFASGCLTNQSGHVLVGQAKLVGGEVGGRESGMVGIKASIQNCNDHAAAVVSSAGAVENAGTVYIDLILHQLGLALFIDLADDDTLTIAESLAGVVEVPCLNANLKATEKSIIVITSGISDLLLIQSSKDFCLLSGDLLIDVSRLIAVQGVILEAHGLITGFISIHQIDDIHGNDHRDLFVILYVFGKLEHYGTIQIVLKVQGGGIFHQLDVRSVVSGDLTIGHGKNTENQRSYKQTDK